MRDYLNRHGGQGKKRFSAAELDAFNRHGWRCHYCGIDDSRFEASVERGEPCRDGGVILVMEVI